MLTSEGPTRVWRRSQVDMRGTAVFDASEVTSETWRWWADGSAFSYLNQPVASLNHRDVLLLLFASRSQICLVVSSCFWLLHKVPWCHSYKCAIEPCRWSVVSIWICIFSSTVTGVIWNAESSLLFFCLFHGSPAARGRLANPTWGDYRRKTEGCSAILSFYIRVYVCLTCSISVCLCLSTAGSLLENQQLSKGAASNLTRFSFWCREAKVSVTFSSQTAIIKFKFQSFLILIWIECKFGCFQPHSY